MNNDAGYLFKNKNLDSLQQTCEKFFQDTNQSIIQKKKQAKINSKKYSIYDHHMQLKKILN